MGVSFSVDTPEGHEWAVVSGLMGIDGPAVVVPIRQLEGLTNEQIGHYVREFIRHARFADAEMQADWIICHSSEKSHPSSFLEEASKYKSLLLEFADQNSRLISEALAFIEQLEQLAEARARGHKTKRAARREAQKNYNELFVLSGKRDGFHCQACGSTERLELDHITPVSLGGLTLPDNLQLLCKSCNTSKGSSVADYRGTLQTHSEH